MHLGSATVVSAIAVVLAFGPAENLRAEVPSAPEYQAALEVVARQSDARTLSAAVAQIEARLVKYPEDLSGFRALARGYAWQGRLPDADLAMAMAHKLGGEWKQALIFASRASRALPEGSPARAVADEVLSSIRQSVLESVSK